MDGTIVAGQLIGALSDDEYIALGAAADRFRPVTGRAAVPALVQARLRR